MVFEHGNKDFNSYSSSIKSLFFVLQMMRQEWRSVALLCYLWLSYQQTLSDYSVHKSTVSQEQRFSSSHSWHCRRISMLCSMADGALNLIVPLAQRTLQTMALVLNPQRTHLKMSCHSSIVEKSVIHTHHHYTTLSQRTQLQNSSQHIQPA